MRIFPNWRAVGRAMLDARRREGVTGPLTAQENSRTWDRTELTWTHEDGRSVEIHWTKGHPEVWLDVKRKPQRGRPANMAGLIDIADAATVLRVLAALGLVPNHIAYAADERYGRCEVCGRVARWWNDKLAPRWVHVKPGAVTGPAAHMAEVAE